MHFRLASVCCEQALAVGTNEFVLGRGLPGPPEDCLLRRLGGGRTGSHFTWYFAIHKRHSKGGRTTYGVHHGKKGGHLQEAETNPQIRSIYQGNARENRQEAEGGVRKAEAGPEHLIKLGATIGRGASFVFIIWCVVGGNNVQLKGGGSLKRLLIIWIGIDGHQIEFGRPICRETERESLAIAW